MNETKSVLNHKIVLVGGCFDFIHYGHIEFLKKAQKLGNQLVVALESDENVRKFKGPQRPIHTQKQRSEMLKSLKFVDKVVALPPMSGDEDYFRLVKTIRPSIIAVTQGDPILQKKQAQAELIGAKLIIIPKIKTPSTTQLAKLISLE